MIGHYLEHEIVHLKHCHNKYDHTGARQNISVILSNEFMTKYRRVIALAARLFARDLGHRMLRLSYPK